jgi:hypothetical protein
LTLLVYERLLLAENDFPKLAQGSLMYRLFIALSAILLLSGCSSSEEGALVPTPLRLRCGTLQTETGFIKFDVTSDKTGTVLLYNDPSSGAPSMRAIPPGHHCEITAEPKE